jgi:hypothetical protein
MTDWSGALPCAGSICHLSSVMCHDAGMDQKRINHTDLIEINPAGKH